MSRLAVGILFGLAAGLGSPIRADEPDAIRAELAKAKKVHAEADAKAKTALLAAIDDTIKAVAGAGDLDGVKALQADKKAFQDSGKVPDSARLRTATAEYVRATKAAQAALEKSYDKAVKDATKALNIDLAEAIQAELKETQARAAGPKAADKVPAGAPRPAAVATKQDLKRFLSGTEWQWGPGIKLKPDGYFSHPEWDRDFLIRWEAIDRRTVLLVVEKGRDHNRYAILTFAEDLTEFRGYDFTIKDPLGPIKRKR